MNASSAPSPELAPVMTTVLRTIAISSMTSHVGDVGFRDLARSAKK